MLRGNFIANKENNVETTAISSKPRQIPVKVVAIDKATAKTQRTGKYRLAEQDECKITRKSFCFVWALRPFSAHLGLYRTRVKPVTGTQCPALFD